MQQIGKNVYVSMCNFRTSFITRKGMQGGAELKIVRDDMRDRSKYYLA
jgi:hypothetical protein